jgi:hypothetical protein
MLVPDFLYTQYNYIALIHTVKIIIMGKQNYQPNRKQPNKRRKKVATAVTFD